MTVDVNTNALGLKFISILEELKEDSAELGECFQSHGLIQTLVLALHPLPRLLVTRLASLKSPTPWEPLLIWLKDDDENNKMKTLRHILKTLQTLNIVIRVGSAATPPVRYMLHQTFRETFLRVVAGAPSMSPIFQLPGTMSPVCAHDLEAFAKAQWQTQLRWIFDAGSAPEVGSESLNCTLLRLLGIAVDVRSIEVASIATMAGSGGEASGTRLRIPTKVAHWLLADLTEQVCMLVFGCLENVANGKLLPQLLRMATSVEALRAQEQSAYLLLMEIASSKIGQPFNSTSLNVVQQTLVDFCHEIGLLYKNGLVFFTTPLAQVLDCNADDEDLWKLAQAFKCNDLGGGGGSGATVLANPSLTDASSKMAVSLPSDRFHPLALQQGVGGPSLGNSYSQQPQHLSRMNWKQAVDPVLELRGSAEISNLSSKVAKSSVGAAGIIVESNFRVFGHFVDQIQLSVLYNICEIKVLTPSLVVGILTRASALQAFQDGVTSQQLNKFFKSHAHFTVRERRSKDSVLPDNVANQLILWEKQLASLKMCNATLFEFSQENELNIFPKVVAKAKAEEDCVLCHSKLPTNSRIDSEEFANWKESILSAGDSGQRAAAGEKSSSAAPSRQFLFGEQNNWMAKGAAILVVKANHKFEIYQQINDLLKT